MNLLLITNRRLPDRHPFGAVRTDETTRGLPCNWMLHGLIVNRSVRHVDRSEDQVGNMYHNLLKKLILPKLNHF